MHPRAPQALSRTRNHAPVSGFDACFGISEMVLTPEGVVQDHTVHSNRSAARLKLNQPGFAVSDALSCVSLAPTWSTPRQRPLP